MFTLIIFSNPYDLALSLLIIDIAIPILLLLGGLVVLPLEMWIQNGFKRDARKKIASMPHLKIVAITGSYGKTSTKFAIASFLKERLNVCVTPGSYNTPMGICKVINNDLNARHEVLILEMGARYEGNIKELCEIAKPDISVITNVGISHLETFGSVEAIATEKSTLATELKPGGTLILNGDDPKVRMMANLRNDVTSVLTGQKGSFEASNIKIGPDGTSFTLKMGDRSTSGHEGEEVEIKTRLL
ncbi:MAG: Mur ligase family protein, partial [Salibacteraceae bacterium]